MNAEFDRLHADLAGLADDVIQVDLRDRAVATSRRIGVRRAMVTTTAAAAVLIASAGVAYAMLPHRATVAPAHPSPAVSTAMPSPTPSNVLPDPTVTATPTHTTSTPPTSSATTLVVDPRTKKIIDASIDMPSWPGFGAPCPAGVTHFHKGVATASSAADNQTQYRMHYEAATLGSAGHVVYANLDGQSADEALITVMCAGDGSLNPEQLLAVRLMPNGTVRSLGFVIATPDHKIFDYDDLSVTVADRTVSVEVNGDHTSNGGPVQVGQVRGYRLNNGAFKQVSGPTKFPAVPTDVRNVDVRNTTISFPGPSCGNGCETFAPVRMVNGVGTKHWIVQSKGASVLTSITFTITQSAAATDRSGAHIVLVRVDETGPAAPAATVVYAVRLNPNGTGWLEADAIAAVGQNGITGITTISGGANRASISVQTASGKHTYTYAQNSTNDWKRSN